MTDSLGKASFQPIRKKNPMSADVVKVNRNDRHTDLKSARQNTKTQLRNVAKYGLDQEDENDEIRDIWDQDEKVPN